jgi:tungstate transport system substrate-binding protein
VIRSRLLPLAFLLAAGACQHDGPDVSLVLATTTSVGNSGLLDMLVPAWEGESGVTIRPLLVGSGRALTMLFESAQADVVISHAPDAEARMMKRHPKAWLYRKIMYNDFVLVGPPEDPAAVRVASTLEDALRRIAASKAPFVSRADQSGTHEREQLLWRIIGAAPAPGRLVPSGAGMAVTLRQASDREAYTLTDRATFEQLKARVQLEIVSQGDARLLNTYAVVSNRLGPRSADATAFMNWLAHGGGRRVIEDYRIRGSGTRPFTAWPADGGHEPHSIP